MLFLSFGVFFFCLFVFNEHAPLHALLFWLKSSIQEVDFSTIGKCDVYFEPCAIWTHNPVSIFMILSTFISLITFSWFSFLISEALLYSFYFADISAFIHSENIAIRRSSFPGLFSLSLFLNFTFHRLPKQKIPSCMDLLPHSGS